MDTGNGLRPKPKAFRPRPNGIKETAAFRGCGERRNGLKPVCERGHSLQLASWSRQRQIARLALTFD